MPLLAATILCAVLAYLAWRRRPSPGASSLGLLLLAVTAWTGLYSIELASPDYGTAMLSAKLEYLSISAIPPIWLIFAAYYTGRGQWFGRRVIGALFIIPLLTIVLVATSDFQDWFFTGARFIEEGGSSYLDIDHGWAFWVHAAYSYLLILWGTGYVTKMLVSNLGLYRRQAAALLVGVAAPWVGNLVYLAGYMEYPDPTPFSFAVLGLAMAYAILGFRLLKIIPVAREKLIEVIADGVLVINSQDIILDSNPAAQQLLGLSASELQGKSLQELARLHPALRACCAELAEGRSEVQILQEADAVYIERLVSVLPQGNQAPGRLVLLRDITERKRVEDALQRACREMGLKVQERTEDLAAAGEMLVEEIARREKTEASLRESERRFVHLIEGFPLGVFVADATGRPLYENRAFQKLSGRSLAELGPVTVFDLPAAQGAYKAGTGKTYPADRTPLARALLGEGSTITDMEFCREDRQLPMEVTGAPIFDGKGELRYAVAVYRDITERRKAEQAIARSEEKYRELVENINDVVFSTDAEGRINYISPVITHLLEYATEEMVGRHFTDFVHREDKNRIIDDIRETLAGKVRPSEYRVMAKSGAVHWVRSSSQPIWSGKSVIGARGMMNDVTSQKEAEEQLRSSLREKEVLLKEVHHRVKNNLQIIQSLLNMQGRQSAEVAVLEALRESQNRVRTMALIHETLYQASDMARVDFGSYLQKLMGELYAAYGVSPSEVGIVVEAGQFEVGIDSAIPLGLIINELVSNSLKHAFPFLTVRAAGGNATQADASVCRTCNIAVRFDTTKNKDETVLEVQDNGIGMPEGLDFCRSGTLGLELVVTLVKQLQGTIELVKGSGTRFLIRFPQPGEG